MSGTLDADLYCNECQRNFSDEAGYEAIGTPCAGCEHDEECDYTPSTPVHFLNESFQCPEGCGGDFSGYANDPDIYFGAPCPECIEIEKQEGPCGCVPDPWGNPSKVAA